MSDRNLGYAVLFFCLVALGIGGFLLVRTLQISREHRVAVFPQIGNLRLEDPVRLNGLEVGRIKMIDWDERRVYLTLMFTESVEVHQDYELETIDKGILGDRYIVLHPGRNSAPIVALEDTLQGQFRPGPSEVLGRMGELKGWIARVDSVFANLQEGDGETPPFSRRFNEMVNLVDSTLIKAQDVTTGLAQSLPRQTARLDTFTEKTSTIVQNMEESVPELLSDLTGSLATLESLVSSTDSIVSGLEQAVVTAQNPENLLWADHIERVSDNLDKINFAIKEVYEFSFQLKLLPKLGHQDE